MNYQILALDLDGTLTNSSKEISEPTLKALIEIQEQGKKVVLASGRPTNGVAPLAEQLRLGDYGSYILSFNGGRITNCQTKEIIYNKTLPMDCAKPIYDMVLEYKDQGLDLVTYTPDALISGICPNKFLITGDSAVISKIQKKIIARFRSYLSVYCSDPFFLEIMPSGIDKAHSLLRLLTSSGLTADEMICCGDGYNDITMIETAGLGVAMANAQPAVLEKADFVTKSNDEDGVLHVINQFMR